MSSKKSFLKLIESQRKKAKKEKFRGNFLDFLDLVKKNPEIADSSHKKLYDTLIGHGVSVMEDSDPRKSKIFEGET